MSSSRRPLVRALGALSLTLTAVLASAPMASAASRTMHDDTGDTYASTDVDPEAAPVRTPSPVADIVSVRTQHRRGAVVVTIRARELPTGMNAAGIVLKVAKQRKPYVVTGVSGSGLRYVTMTRGATSVRDLKCRGLRMRFDVADNVARATVPRSCLGSPRWVRTGVFLMSTTASTSADSPTMFVDIAGVNTVPDAWWSANALPPLPLGPKVRVG